MCRLTREGLDLGLPTKIIQIRFTERCSDDLIYHIVVSSVGSCKQIEKSGHTLHPPVVANLTGQKFFSLLEPETVPHTL
jgi:hypothetical protein